MAIIWLKDVPQGCLDPLHCRYVVAAIAPEVGVRVCLNSWNCMESPLGKDGLVRILVFNLSCKAQLLVVEILGSSILGVCLDVDLQIISRLGNKGYGAYHGDSWLWQLIHVSLLRRPALLNLPPPRTCTHPPVCTS